MRKIFLAIALIISFSASSQFVNFISRNNAADTSYGTHYDTLQRGGYQVVQNKAVRNAIPYALRKKGMWVKTAVDDSVFNWDGSTWQAVVFSSNYTPNYTDTVSVTTSLWLPLLSGREYSMLPNSQYFNLFRFYGSHVGTGSSYPDDLFLKFTGITANNYHLPTKVEFATDAINLQIDAYGQGGSSKVFVDDTLVTTLNCPVDGGFHYWKITFKSKRFREIRIENLFTAGRVTVDNAAEVYRTKRPIRLKCIVMGDSFTEYPEGFAYWLGKYMNWDIWASGSGGTGYVNPGATGRVNFLDRIVNDVIANNPDVVIMAGGINDIYNTTGQRDSFNANFSQCLDSLSLQLPTKRVYVVGAWQPDGNPNASKLVQWSQMRQISLNKGYPYIDNTTWMTGDRGDSATGNAYWYTGSDGTHPSDLGAQYLGLRLATAIRDTIPTITKQENLIGGIGFGIIKPDAKIDIKGDSAVLPLKVRANNTNYIQDWVGRYGTTSARMMYDGGGNLIVGSDNLASSVNLGSSNDAPFLKFTRSQNNIDRPMMLQYITYGQDSIWFAGLKGGSKKYSISWGVEQNTSSTKLEIDSAGNVTVNKFIKRGGTSSQLLAADGSVVTAGTGITISSNVISATGNNIVAQDVSQSVTGITTDRTFVTYTTPNDASYHSYRVGGDVTISNLGGSSVKLRVSFTDVNGNAVTQDYYPMGAITSALPTGYTAMPSVTITTAYNTAISVQMIFTSTIGGVIYFGHGVIEDLGVVYSP